MGDTLRGPGAGEARGVLVPVGGVFHGGTRSGDMGDGLAAAGAGPSGCQTLHHLPQLPTVSILMPVHNAALFLGEALESILGQTYSGAMELAIFDDGPSTDDSLKILLSYREAMLARHITLLIEQALPGSMLRGCGYGRNQCYQMTSGSLLCFADADDMMMSQRIELQVALALEHSSLLVGSNFLRLPGKATPRYTAWANGLTQEQLYTQQLVENTIVTPTWLCSRAVFEAAGPFDETGPGTPDDLLFFYRHLSLGGLLAKVEEALVVYRFHPASVTGSRGCPSESIWAVRVAHLEARLLQHLPWCRGFTIWNAGKEGKKLFRSLSSDNQAKVIAFCDVDVKKVRRGNYIHMPTGRLVPILHWTAAQAPLLLCVKRNLLEGDFEGNVLALGLVEGLEYVHFS